MHCLLCYEAEGDFIVVTSLRFENRPNFGDESDFERKSYRQLLNSCWSQIPRERPQMKGRDVHAIAKYQCDFCVNGCRSR